MQDVSANINILISACQKISRFILRDFGEIEQLQSSIRGADNFVSSSLLRIENVLTDILLESRPRYGLVTANTKKQGLDIAHKFIINVMDGVNSFRRGMPFFAISIAIEEQKKIIASVIYVPVLDKIFYAEKGRGAFVIESRFTRRIRVSHTKDLFAASIGIAGDNHQQLQLNNPVYFSSACLSVAYFAASSLDAVFVNTDDFFDLSAGILIAKEAGGTVIAFDENKKLIENHDAAKTICFVNSNLEQKIKEYFSKN